jgi:hypothetical protein
MNSVRLNGKKLLAVTLGVVTLAGLVPAALAQKGGSGGTGAAGGCCGKTLGRGNGYAVAITVVLAGKPAAAASVTVNTLHGVPVKSAKTSSTGVAKTMLPPGDYIVMAKTKGDSGMVKLTVPANPTAPVPVTVTLTPQQ